MQFEVCIYSDVSSFNTYLASLSAPIDSFLEEHLLESQFYRIVLDGVEVGSFAIHSNLLLTHFYLVREAAQHGVSLFEEILKRYTPKAAFVPTCDEFLLSHALDKHSTIKKQAFFFLDSGVQTSIVSKHPTIDYRLATMSDIPALKTIENSIIEEPEESVQNREVHVGYIDDQLVAIGLIAPSQFWKNQASIGMLTEERFRRQGIATQTIQYLKQVCKNSGFIPVAGCAYGNVSSRLTLQAAGMVTQTRLLKIEFS